MDVSTWNLDLLLGHGSEVWPRDKHMVVLKLLSSIHPFKGLSGCGYVVVMPDGGFSAQNFSAQNKWHNIFL